MIVCHDDPSQLYLDGTAAQSSSGAVADISSLQAGLAHRERQIDAIRRISNALFSHTSVDDMVRETLTVAIEVLRADAGSLLMHEPHSNTLIFRYVIGPAAEALTDHVMPASQGIAGRVFTTGTPDLTHKVQERAEFDRSVDEKTGYRTESMMTVPVRRPEGTPIGVMQVLNASSPFDHYDLEVLEVLCSQAAVAIENARLLREARKAQIVNVIGDISHDIKNMLTPIQSGVWTLQPMMDEMMEELRALRESCPEKEAWGESLERIISLVGNDYTWILENALDAADKVQSRTREIADTIKGVAAPPFFEKANLNDTAQEVVRALHLVAQNNGVQLRLMLDAKLPAAMFDRKQIYNAVYNLVNNAIPETPQGGAVTISTRRPEPDEETLLLQVIDTGRGMPEKVRRRLFTEEAISTKPGGTGLGTTIVAGVVQRHKGTITVESVEGEGSTFNVRLPLQQ